jgi:hypothetical protein
MHELSKTPGGGSVVEAPTPGGSKIYGIWGQQQREVPATSPTATTVNFGRYRTSVEKFRKGKFRLELNSPYGDV